MKTLLILRHAKSSWKHPDLDDIDRPLNKRGRQDAPRIGALLRELGLLPDLILSSPARRAHDTAQIVADHCGYGRDEIRFKSQLYLADTPAYIDVLSQLPPDAQTVLVVGHNPDLEILLEDLTGEHHPMPTAALAQIELPISSWAEFDPECEGKLVHLWQPRQLD